MARSNKITEKGRHTPRPGPRKIPPGRGYPHPPPHTRSLSITPNRVRIYGWPSRGGLIVLNATLLDFEFLGWNPRHAPGREKDQDNEDGICQRLLRLGATWYDNTDRLNFLDCFEDAPEWARLKMGSGEYPPPTLIERRWVKVGWPSDGKGLWVYEVDNDDVFGPELGGEFFASLEEYRGLACINAWNTKATGFVA